MKPWETSEFQPQQPNLLFIFCLFDVRVFLLLGLAVALIATNTTSNVCLSNGSN